MKQSLRRLFVREPPSWIWLFFFLNHLVDLREYANRASFKKSEQRKDDMCHLRVQALLFEKGIYISMGPTNKKLSPRRWVVSNMLVDFTSPLREDSLRR